jgi:hypothetical protein
VVTVAIPVVRDSMPSAAIRVLPGVDYPVPASRVRVTTARGREDALIPAAALRFPLADLAPAFPIPTLTIATAGIPVRVPVAGNAFGFPSTFQLLQRLRGCGQECLHGLDLHGVDGITPLR